MIVARDLTKDFGSRTAVESVSFEVARSEIVALLGPNGAGKTTTMRMLAGLVGPTRGSVTIDGVELTRQTGSALRRKVGFLTEAPGLWDRLTVRENLTVYASLYGIDQIDRTVDRILGTFDLSAQASTRAAELSKGQRQKVALGRALLHEPAILLLDEPTSGLDPEVIRSVRLLLDERRSRGCAILLSTHNLHEAERQADRIAVLHRRLLALDTPTRLRARLATGRVVIRTASNAVRWIDTVRLLGHAAEADGPWLTVTIQDPDAATPPLVAALVAAGAGVLEVKPERPALEDVYLHLVGEHP